MLSVQLRQEKTEAGELESLQKSITRHHLDSRISSATERGFNLCPELFEKKEEDNNRYISLLI